MVEVSLEDLISQQKSRQSFKIGRRRMGRRFGGISRSWANKIERTQSVFRRPFSNSWSIKRTPQPFSKPTGGSSPETLIVSNLDPQVNDTDMRELFETVGPLRKANVHYTSDGQSLGTAEVIFMKRGDAHRAVQQYSRRVLKLSVLSDEARAVDRLQSARAFNPRREIYMHDRRGSAPRGRQRNNPAMKTTDELDAELDTYMVRLSVVD